jgi:hypothetical protein
MAKFEQGIVVLHAPLGHVNQTVNVTAAPLNALPALDRIRRVVIRTVDQPICWRDDGTAPTNTTGMYLAAGDTLVYDGTRADQLQLIRAITATTDADVRLAYFGV